MLFFGADVSAFDNVLMHERFAEQGNTKRNGGYLPFLEKVIEFA